MGTGFALNPYHAFIWVLLGALGGGLGGFAAEIYRKRARQPRQGIFFLIVGIFVVATLTAGRLGLYSRIKYALFPQATIEDVAMNFGKAIMKDPSFVAATRNMNPAEVQIYVADLTRHGLKRLDFKNLKVWNSLRLEMSKTDQAYCASLWNGQDQAILAGALQKLPVRDLKKLMDVSNRAALLALKDDPAQVIDKNEIQRGLESIANNLPDNEVQRFRRAILGGMNIPDEEACFLMSRVMEGVGRLPPAQEESFLRAMTEM